MKWIPWIIMLGTSFWVLYDAKKHETREDKADWHTGKANSGPWGWFFFCLILWVVAFPCYVFKRKSGSYQSLVRVSGIVLPVIVIGIGVLIITGDIKPSTPEIRDFVQSEIEKQWGQDPIRKEFKIKSFTLVHKSGNEYEGVMQVDSAGFIHNLGLTVFHDGKNCVWQPRN